MKIEEYETLLPYCVSDVEKEAFDAILRYGNQTQAARQLGKARETIRDVVNRVRLRSKEESGLLPPGHKLVGLSTLTKTADGDPQWVKTKADAAQQEELMRQAVEAFKEQIPATQSTKLKNTPRNGDLLNLYILTDYHMGMKAWGEETGADWDANIAENLLTDWFTTAIAASPPAKYGVLGQLGDFLHWDGIEAVTPTAKHILDADTRLQRLIRVAIRSTRRILQMMLEKYEEVHVIMAEGNHDPAGSMWMREMLREFYAKEPRLTVDTNPSNYYALSHGDVALFFHHGHKKKMEKIDDVFVAKYRKIFGDSTYAYAHMGHLHHNKVLETNLMEIEQHQTLAAPDAYATHGGWVSGRSAKCITYDKKHGEVFRITLRPEMVASNECKS